MEIHNIIKLTNQVSLFSILIPGILAISRFKTREKAMRLFAGFILLSVFIDFLAWILIKQKVITNNMPMLWGFTYLEFLFFSLIFIQLIRLPYFKSIGYFGLVIFALFLGGEAYYQKGLGAFNSVSRTVEATILIIYGLLYFFQILRSNDHYKLERFPWFWINVGILTYFIGNIFMFMVYNVFVVSLDTSLADLWVIHSILNIVANIIYAIGLACHRIPRI